MCSKLKRIQSGFKKAIDSGRSGGGRIVTTLYEECSAIWGGSPTVKCIKNGIESCRQQDVEEQGTSAPAPDTSNLINTQDSETEDLLKENETKNDDGRRSLLKFLHDKRDSKLTKKSWHRCTANGDCKGRIDAQEEGSREHGRICKKKPSENHGFVCNKFNSSNYNNQQWFYYSRQANEVHTTPTCHSHDSLYNFHRSPNFNQFQMLDNYKILYTQLAQLK